jgi:Sugar (pentulose and hexulose) kinases
MKSVSNTLKERIMATYLLGIDNGGTVTKVILFDTSGKEVAIASRKCEVLMPHPDWTERDMHEMRRTNLECIREVIAKSGVSPKDIAGIGATGHGNGLYLVDKDGQPVRNGIISTDTRAKDYIDRWYADGTHAKQLPRTMQSIWAGQPVALLAWIKDHEPENYARIDRVLMCKDYVSYCLTGEYMFEATDGSGSSLMNVRDVSYDKDLLETWGIGEVHAKLPPLCTSADIRGWVTAEAAAATGLIPDTPVVGGMMDVHAAAVSTGVVDDTRICVVAGTWSINEYVSTTPVVHDELFMTSLFCTPGTWLILEASPTSASNLEWFVTHFMGEERMLNEGQGGKSLYECASEMVESIGVEDSNIIFLPFLYGSNADPHAKACFVGLAGWHTKAHTLRALYEGVCFAHRKHIDNLFLHSQNMRTIRIAGGAAKSRTWVQMFADILQMPVESIAGEELSAIGAAIAAGVGTGHFASFDATQMVRVQHVCMPDPSKKKAYDAKYALYCQTVAALSPVWKKM